MHGPVTAAAAAAAMGGASHSKHGGECNVQLSLHCLFACCVFRHSAPGCQKTPSDTLCSAADRLSSTTTPPLYSSCFPSCCWWRTSKRAVSGTWHT